MFEKPVFMNQYTNEKLTQFPGLEIEDMECMDA
jgi:hypothetical protein